MFLENKLGKVPSFQKQNRAQRFLIDFTASKIQSIVFAETGRKSNCQEMIHDVRASCVTIK